LRFSEIALVPELVEEEIRSLQTIAREYKEEDIYNIDETGLY
jgi:hypothetical protein